MKVSARFSDPLLKHLSSTSALRIRAGSGEHRFIGIWVVVVKNRVFVRSWSVKPDGWYEAFRKEPRGAIQVSGDEIAVRAVHIRSNSLCDAIDRAYLEKYNTKGSLKYAKDLGSRKSRATTIELLPAASSSSGANLSASLQLSRRRPSQQSSNSK